MFDRSKMTFTIMDYACYVKVQLKSITHQIENTIKIYISSQSQYSNKMKKGLHVDSKLVY